MTDQTGLFRVLPPDRVIGIVGVEAAKLDAAHEADARAIIRILLTQPDVMGYSSGHCHLGGIDILTEEIGEELNLEPFIYPPPTKSWETGYKPRNIQIVNASTEVHCITVKELPSDYKGMRFKHCYHCDTNEHIKSGGCWTAKYAKKKGKPAFWHVI